MDSISLKYAQRGLAVTLGLLLATPAFAQERLPTVQVYADQENSAIFSCEAKAKFNSDDVTRLLDAPDAGRLPDLRKRLAKAVAEACAAGEARILVQRSASGLTWRPWDSADAGETSR